MMAARPDAGSEPDSSPPAFLGQARSSKSIPRRLFCIPPEQQKLLDDASSWAGALYRRPQRIANVPVDVLNDIEEHQTRSRAQSKQPRQSSVSGPEQPKSSRATEDNSDVESEAPDNKFGNDESDGDVIGGWSLSPERDLQFKRHRELAPKQPPVDDRPSSPRVFTPQQDASPEQPFASQLPKDDRCPPPRTTSSQQDTASEKSFASQLPPDGVAAPEAMTRRCDAALEPTFVTQQPASKVPASPSETSVPQHSASPEQPFASQPPTSVPPRSTNGALNRPRKRPNYFNSFPPSSSGPEEELEVVPPAPYIRTAPRTRNPPAVNPTPPSAQVQVPCTAGFEPDDSIPAPPLRKPKSGNRSRYKHSDVSGLLNDPIPKTLPATVSGLRRPPTNTKSTRQGPNSSISDAFVSSSIVPSTHPGKIHSAPPKAPPSKPVAETQRPARQSSISSESSPGRLPQLRPLSPNLARPLLLSTERVLPQHQPITTWSSPATVAIPHRNTQQPSPALPATLPDTSPLGASAVKALENRRPVPPMPQAETGGSSTDIAQRQAPFIRFSLNYLSYKGSIGDFFTACSYIKSLQRKRALASYSYDDFIRAWHQGYLPYIECFSGSTKEPMSAIEWYVESVPRIEFMSGIVTKENLESVLAYYQPEEVRMARQRAPISSRDSLATRDLSGTQARFNVPCASSGLQTEERPAVQPHSPPNAEGALPLTHSPEKPGGDRDMELGRAVEEATSALESQQQSQSDPVDKTGGDTPVPRLHQESLRRSASERDSRKRNAEDDGILPTSKMTRYQDSGQGAVSSTSNRSERLLSGRSSFSGTPRSTGYKGPKKYMHNLAKRRASLEKYFAKSLGKRPRDSIVSSSIIQQHSEAS